MSSILPNEKSANSLKIIAPAKINLHLEVLGFRQDGFHEMAMVMQSINLFDEIDFSRANDARISLTSDMQSLSTGEDNLILKAAKLLKKYSKTHELGALIHLKKNIPIGAGLAGGSSDAAATLLGLNSLWELGLSIKELEFLASKLGSDVPFCVSGGTQLCFGRGESLEPLKNSREELSLLLVKDPSIEDSTPWAYAKYKEINGKSYLASEKDFSIRRKLLKEAHWVNNLSALNHPALRNDLQEVVAPLVPAVQHSLEFLSSLKGIIGFAMSGSGPSCFALFPNFQSAKTALEDNQNKLELLGLKGWCCSFKSTGVSIIS